MHPGRSARSHLRSMAATHKIKASRVSEVIEMTGLAGVATKRVAGFSLGMASAWTSPPPPRRPQDAHPRRAGQRAADVDGRAVSAAIAGANAPGRGPLHPSQAKEVLAAISDALAGAELTVDQLTEAIAARRSW